MQIPLINIRTENDSIRSELDAAVKAVIDSGQFILGPAVERFETDFAQYLGARHCIGLNSGTSALHMALIACGLSAGDEVITTPLTWISTAWAVSYVGAIPVFVDVDQDSCTLDIDQLERSITPKTKAILPVHLYGRAANVADIKQLADARGIALIEDTAQAHGASLAGRKLGTFGRAGCFSFYPTKNLGAFGEAGAVVTDDDDVAQRIRRLRDHAQADRHQHVELGFNTRMEGIQGAVLGVKLRYLDRWIARRREIANRYLAGLRDCTALTLPATPAAENHVWHQFVILCHDRDALQAQLAKHGIASSIHYPTPVHLQPAYAHLGHQAGAFPTAERIAAQCLSLPISAQHDDAEIDHVVDILRDVCSAAT